MEHYMYSDTTPKPMPIWQFVISMLVYIIFILPAVIMTQGLVSPYQQPKALIPEYAQSEEYIIDMAEVIDNEESLVQNLKEFQSLTGIAPYVVTVKDSVWKNKSATLEDYAFNVYVSKFLDEQHFLIVYSEPDDAKTADFVDWSWEAIQGNDTDAILTEAHFERFQRDLQHNLNAGSVGKAFEIAFSNSLDYMMEKAEFSGIMIMNFAFPIFWCLVLFIMISSTVKQFILSRRDYEEAPADGSFSKYRPSDSYTYEDSYME